ncbi:PHP-associated domain-containing protein [Chloroflexota bacterium]
MKLDLHTHCSEAIYAVDIGCSDLEAAQKIVEAVKKKGLDGIAITDHYGSDFAFKVKKLVEDELGNEVLIIPGQEIDRRSGHLVELYLPDGFIFRFIPHPHVPNWLSLKGIHGIEIENGQDFLYSINHDEVREFGQRHNLLFLSNSDAHSLLDIGSYYNEIELRELCHRVQGNG